MTAKLEARLQQLYARYTDVVQQVNDAATAQPDRHRALQQELSRLHPTALQYEQYVALQREVCTLRSMLCMFQSTRCLATR
jgi:protein subunit release factor A